MAQPTEAVSGIALQKMGQLMASTVSLQAIELRNAIKKGNSSVLYDLCEPHIPSPAPGPPFLSSGFLEPPSPLMVAFRYKRERSLIGFSISLEPAAFPSSLSQRAMTLTSQQHDVRFGEESRYTALPASAPGLVLGQGET